MNPVLKALRKRDLETTLKVEDDRLIISATQDCTPIAERAKALHNAGLYGSNEMRHVASLPRVIVEKYCNDTGVSFAEVMGNPQVHIKRICENPDNDAFRIWKGRL